MHGDLTAKFVSAVWQVQDVMLVEESGETFLAVDIGLNGGTRALDKREFLVIIRDNFC